MDIIIKKLVYLIIGFIAPILGIIIGSYIDYVSKIYLYEAVIVWFFYGLIGGVLMQISSILLFKDKLSIKQEMSLIVIQSVILEVIILYTGLFQKTDFLPGVSYTLTIVLSLCILGYLITNIIIIYIMKEKNK